MALLILGLIFIAFLVYEHQIHKYYRRKMDDEKLISYFSQTRMQLMKMLHTGEISHRTSYFNIMIRATSYSIRALYLYNNKSPFKINYNALKEMMPYIVDKNMKEEFATLTVEQKELFVNTILKMIQLHIRDNVIEKAIFNLYMETVKEKVNSAKVKIISKLVSTTKENRQKITYLDDISSSYNIPRYAYA